VQSPSVKVETSASGNMKHIQEAGPLPFQLQNFEEKAAALKWLTGNPVS